METVECTYQVIDNMIIVNVPDGLKDNSQYELRIKGLQSTDGTAQLDAFKYTFVTAMTPSYCTVSDLAAFKDTFDIPESMILYYIREASKYADYIKEASASIGSSTQVEVTFPMFQFVRTKVMLDCLLKAFINKAAGAGIKGTLGKISFENTEKYSSNLDDLLDFLKAQLKMWQDAIRGYELEGRAAPVWSKKAYKTQNPTTFAQLINDISREEPVV